ncbi:unnamed protein product, partial [Prorocentrum cordatum]
PRQRALAQRVGAAQRAVRAPGRAGELPGAVGPVAGLPQEAARGGRGAEDGRHGGLRDRRRE